VQEVPVLKNEMHAGAGIFFPQKCPLSFKFKKKIVSVFSRGNTHGAGEFQHPSVGRHLTSRTSHFLGTTQHLIPIWKEIIVG
jgi:hypothetical protein